MPTPKSPPPPPASPNETVGRTWADILARPPRWFLYALLVLLALAIAGVVFLWTTGTEIKYGSFRIGPVLAQSPMAGVPLDGSPVDATFKKQSVLFVTGGASADGDGEFRSTLTVHVLVDKKECSSNRTYVPNNWKITHILSTVCVLEVQPDRVYRIEVVSEGEGVSNKKTRMSYVALPSS